MSSSSSAATGKKEAFTSSTRGPPTPIPAAIQSVLASFFRLVDTKDDPEACGKQLAEDVFTADAVLSTPGGTFTGKEEIAKSRNGAWDVVTYRYHAIDRVYVAPSGPKDLQVAGSVEMHTVDGKVILSEFSARVNLVAVQGGAGEEDKFKIKNYEAWAGPLTTTTLAERRNGA